MDENEDLGDPRSREKNRKYLNNAKRSIEVFRRYFVIHPYKKDNPEIVKAILGLIIVVVVIYLFVMEHFGFF